MAVNGTPSKRDDVLSWVFRGAGAEDGWMVARSVAV